MKEISFNSKVKVKLTDEGFEVLTKYYKRTFGSDYKLLILDIDENGFYSFTIYQLMQIFGSDARINYNLFASDIVISNFDVQEYDNRPPRKRRGE